MISVCYLIVGVSLLYSFDQAESISHTKSLHEQYYEQTQLFKPLTAENQDTFVANIISPYWNLTYNEQLDMKQNRCYDIVIDIVTQSDSLLNNKKFRVHKIVPSPVTEAYRSKDEFTIWNGFDGNPKTVGIKIGKSSLGKAICFRPTKIVSIKESHKRVAQVYEDYIRSSPLPACLRLNKGGHWRSITVRSNEAGDIMALVVVQPRGFTYKRMQDEQKAMTEYFLEHLPNISLFQQKCMYFRCTHEHVPFNLLYGKPYLKDTLNGYKFKITPDTFFPMNKMSAEVLNDNIIKMAKLKPNTTVFDICSGTGITSIVVSKFVRKVFGFDDMPNAYKKGIENARINNIDNVDFVLGLMEKQLESVLKNQTALRDIVAIVNSAITRPGSYGVKTIRKSPQISRIVYISSQPDSTNDIDNFHDLCSTMTSTYPPFRLTKVIPVDLLPQTANVEILLLFER